MGWRYIVPRVGASCRQGYDVLNGGRAPVRASLVPVNWTTAKKACPAVQFKKKKGRNAIAACVYCSSLWTVVFDWLLAPCPRHSICDLMIILSLVRFECQLLVAHCYPVNVDSLCNLVVLLIGRCDVDLALKTLVIRVQPADAVDDVENLCLRRT